MVTRRSRSAVALLVSGAVLVATAAVVPAAAEDPLSWSTVPGFPVTTSGVTVTWETASSTTSPFDGTVMLDPMPILRPEITNDSGQTVYIGLGLDLRTQGAVDHLWMPEAWGIFADDGFSPGFWSPLDAGDVLSTSGESASGWHQGVPSWSGHSYAVFLLSEPPTDVVDPAAVEIARLTVTGGFVPAHVDDQNLPSLSALMGQHLTVDGGGGAPDLFPGVVATANATGLPPGETLEVWAVPDFDYFFFSLLGGGLPTTATPVGSGTVAADGALRAVIVLPQDLPLGDYQVVAGVRADRYWPAGSWDDFAVTAPPATVSGDLFQADATPSASLEVGTAVVQEVYLEFESISGDGEASVAVSGTGPAPTGFELATEPPLYFHITTDVDFTGSAWVCLAYDPTLLAGDAPRLLHFDTALGEWVDITSPTLPDGSAAEPGLVCGQTTSFSPFALAFYPFSGFSGNVSEGGDYVAKAGRSIPLTFSLSGDKGLDVVESARYQILGEDSTPSGTPLETTTTNRSGLTYDPLTDQYTYVWKTSRDWANTHGEFVLTLADGTEYGFAVSFQK